MHETNHTANFPDPYIHPKSIMELIDSSYELVRVYAIMMNVNVTDLRRFVSARQKTINTKRTLLPLQRLMNCCNHWSPLGLVVTEGATSS